MYTVFSIHIQLSTVKQLNEKWRFIMESQQFLSAESPFTAEGKNYHLGISSKEIAKTILLPGDPARVALISEGWETHEVVGHNREFITHTGTTQGYPVSAISTGIGNPAMATVVESLARMGATTFIRVGTTGSIQEEIDCGDLVIASGAVRLDGASKAYVRPEFPAAAHPEAVMALIQACEELGYKYHVGVTASTDSWYLGQSRPGWQDYFPSFAKELIEDLRIAGVLNFEMESSALLTLTNLYRLRAGAIFTVVANRLTNSIIASGIEKSIAAANRSVKILAEMDKEKRDSGKKYWYPGLRELR